MSTLTFFLTQKEKVMSEISYELLSKTHSRPIHHFQLVTKTMSQLIARSWLPGGEEIRSVLLSEDSAKILQMFKDNGIDIEEMFKTSRIEVDWSTFLGRIEDTTDPSEPLKLVIAYPPRPSDYNLSDSDLEDWVQNQDPKQKVPNHPYIPVTY